MKKILFKPSFILPSLLAASCLFYYLINRNYEENSKFDEYVAALKDGHGDYALENLLSLANNGDQQAQSIVAQIYAHGWSGVKRNDRAAIYWFTKCGTCGIPIPVEEGASPLAANEFYVARDFANGTQLDHKDDVEAVKWFQRAAANGSREAMVELKKRGASTPSSSNP